MRCPSCGTENAPDSRFCGGCGAKLTPAGAMPSKPPLAATAKIPDDAPFPAPTGQRPQIQQGYQQGPASIPPPANPYGATGPASIPPTSKGPASIPPHASFPRAQSPRPSEASLSSRPTPLAPELRPASRPPDEPAFASMPPTQQRKPVARPSTPVPAGSLGGDSLVLPPQRPLGLIAIVLVIDFALAGAGAVMLSKGLAKKTAEDPGPPKAPEQKMQQRTEAVPPPAPSPTPAPAASPTEAVANAAAVVETKPDSKLPASAAALVEAKPDKSPTRDTKTSKKKDAPKTTTSTASASTSTSSGPVTHPGGGTTPEDPYKDQPKDQPKDPPKDQPAASGFDLKAESNKLASQSGDLFARCLAAAGTVHGTIKVAYRVQANGSVEHPFAVENSTGNEQLGICLADVIATWRYSAHSGDTQNAVRPFNYP